MPRIFISYRRDDAAFAAHAISEKLKELFGKESITIDENFSLGDDFAKNIDEAVRRCDVLLAVIGDRWLDIRYKDGPMQGQRRLDDPDDWVRLEIASALKKDILVIPVFVGDVSMKAISPGLPPDLADLAKKVALSVRTGRELPDDLQSLVMGVEQALGLPPLTPDDLKLPPGVKVVPQGLRSFNEKDDDFFIYLLPGPYQKDGLPESLCFWKTRIEAMDAEMAFRVGLIYGPSGCGKSSLIKAGLLPRLAEHVTAVYIEATATDTEARLLAELHKHCPCLAGESVQAALKHKDQIPGNQKVLIVLDQFEQYLHSTSAKMQGGLIDALRQCDGGKLQCLLMVRDDFLTPATRFMKKLNVPFAQERNLALVDLFDRLHAKKVLALLGQAYGCLPNSGHLQKEQDTFLNNVISDLSQGDHVNCVRLALFAQMFEGKEWKPATLQAMGGATGVGVAFLEDSLVTKTELWKKPGHAAAAQRVLSALLPEPGTTIKGAMRTRDELLKKSGYASSPGQFDQLMEVLDQKLRLVTPTDPVLKSSDGRAEQVAEAERHYQLTHDYLVPSLRDWITSKKRETRRGRAELRLAERSELWAIKPEKRHLPSLWEFLNICLLTENQNWSEPQRKMMGKAGRVHGIRSGIVTAALIVMSLTGLGIRHAVVEKQNATRAEGLVEALVNADIAKVPAIINDLENYRRWADPLLKARFDQAKEGSSQRLNMALALLPVDESKTNSLRDQLLVVTPIQFPVVRDALLSHKDAVIEPLWSVALDSKRETRQRFQAACALATYTPSDQRWKQIAVLVAGHLVTLQASDLVAWREALRPAKSPLVEPLVAIYRNPSQDQQQRSFATETLANYAADQPPVLAELVMDADEKQFVIIFSKLKERGEAGLPLLQNEIKKPLPDTTEDAKEALAKRQTNAAVALVKMDHAAEVWPLLKQSPDPRVRSWIIHKLSPLGADPGVIVKRFWEETDVSIRRALLLSLGEFGEPPLATAERDLLIEKLHGLYSTDPDPGLHAAAEWLLRHWKQDQWLKQMEKEWAGDKQQREKRLDGIKQALAKDKPQPQWYVNGQGQTMVVIQGPVEFSMGSPEGESGRFEHELLHRQRIGRSFVIAAKAVTVEQYLRFDKGYMTKEIRQYTPDDDCPIVGTSWYQAAKYCNWLSKQEGLSESQWCYEPTKDGDYAEGMKAAADFLKRTGYRLPTEAEWEYACRAGAATSRYYGQTEDLLPKYGWYQTNSHERSWLVGSLKPNDLGLFDMHGNIWTWCQDSYRRYQTGKNGEVVEDAGDASLLNDKVSRVLRGGSFFVQSRYLRSANRNWNQPVYRNADDGFRPARTYNFGSHLMPLGQR